MGSPTERWLQLLASPKSSFSSKKEASQRLGQILKQHPANSSSIFREVSGILLSGTNDAKICIEAFVLPDALEEFSIVLISSNCDWFQNEESLSLPPIRLIGSNRKTLNQFLLDNDFLPSKPSRDGEYSAESSSSKFSTDDLLGLPEGVAQLVQSTSEGGVIAVKKEIESNFVKKEDEKEERDEDEPPVKTARLQEVVNSEQNLNVKKEEIKEENEPPLKVRRLQEKKEAKKSFKEMKQEVDPISGRVRKNEKAGDNLDVWKYLTERQLNVNHGTAPETTSETGSESLNSELVSTLINMFVLFFNKMNSEDWEERHGAAMGVKCFMRSLPESLMSDSLVEIVLDKALKVLVLDRLSDFVDDETVFPVREVLAQLVIFLFQSRSEDERLNRLSRKVIRDFLKEYEWNVVIDGLLLLTTSTKTGFSDELYDRDALSVVFYVLQKAFRRFSFDSDIIRFGSKFLIGLYSKMGAKDRRSVYYNIVKKVLTKAMRDLETLDSAMESISKEIVELFSMCLNDSAVARWVKSAPRVIVRCFSISGGEEHTKWEHRIRMLKNCCWLKLFNYSSLDTLEFSQCVTSLCNLPWSSRDRLRFMDYYFASLLFCTKLPPKSESELALIRSLILTILSSVGSHTTQHISETTKKLMNVLNVGSSRSTEFDLTLDFEISVVDANKDSDHELDDDVELHDDDDDDDLDENDDDDFHVNDNLADDDASSDHDAEEQEERRDQLQERQQPDTNPSARIRPRFQQLTIPTFSKSVSISVIAERDNPSAYNELVWVISKLIFLQEDRIDVITSFLQSSAFTNQRIALLSILYNQSKINKNYKSWNVPCDKITEIIGRTNFVFDELKESFENLQSTVKTLDPQSSEEQNGERIEENMGARVSKFVSCRDSLSATAREALDRLKASYEEYEHHEKMYLIDVKALSACSLVALERYPEKISPIVNSLLAGLKFSSNNDYLELMKEAVKNLCKSMKLTPKACEKLVECLLTFMGEKNRQKESGSLLPLEPVAGTEEFSDGSAEKETSIHEKWSISKISSAPSANLEAIMTILCENKPILGTVTKLEEVLKLLENDLENIESNLLKFCYFFHLTSIKLPDDFVALCLQTIANIAETQGYFNEVYKLCVAIFAKAAGNKNLSKQLFHFVFVNLLKRSFSDDSEEISTKQFVLDMILMIAVEEDKRANLDDVMGNVTAAVTATQKKKVDSYNRVLMLAPVLQSISHHNFQIRKTAASAFGLVLPQAVMAIDSEVVKPPAKGKKSGRKSVNKMIEDLKGEHDSSAQFVSRLLNNQAFDDCCIPDCVKASLRPYQKEGVAWLQFLRNYNLGGILADDMGLGKTLTCICLLADQMLKTKQLSLVACPKSLIHHWKNEIQTFCPDLSCFCIDYKSAISDAPNDVSVFVTSYDVIRSCSDTFAEKYMFDYLILDEGHVIKNVKSKLFQAVQKLKANHRLVLTGTPIQNDVCELWTLFEFLIPSYLGSLNQFRSTFANPVKASNSGKKTSVKNLEKCSKALKLLHSKVLPLILRREKENVLEDLPPKTIQDIACDMSPQQKKLYSDIEKKFESCSSEKTSALKLLQLLLKICNQPSAVDPTKTCTSGKIEALKDLLFSIFPSYEDSLGTEMNCIPHRALVFFQTKSMMDFVLSEICENAEWKHLSYLVLSGKLGAAERMNVVKKFNSDPSVNLLLCTTAVGGVGLNLTGADIVIFVEHDFNPVKDLQAMDRAHRIGQRRPVNVYRLITRDSVEENIMNVQKFKTALAKAVVNEDNTGIQSMDTSSILDSFLSMSNSGDDRSRNAKEAATNKNAESSLSGLLAELDHLWTPLRKLDDVL